MAEPPVRASRTRRPYLVVLRFLVVNAVALAIAFAIYLQGWLEDASQGLTLWLSALIGVVFAYGTAVCGYRIWQVARETEALNRRAGEAEVVKRMLPASPAGQYLAAEALRLGLLGRINLVQHVAGSLVLLGLVGTVVGFIVALGGVEPASASRVEEVAPMVATLINGMSIALYTTLFGAVAHLWLSVNYRLLRGATVEYYRRVIEIVGDVGVRVG